jgi:flagellar basal-body rod modification protein FlgD
MSSVEVTNTKTLQQIIDETSERAQERKTGELDKDAFINLLVTQLRYQDPLNPVNDKEFIGQMAQFSALEQMQNLNASFSSTKAFSLIGKRIRANVIDNATKGTRIVEGNVSAVKISQGRTFVVVRGEDVPVDKITDVTDGLGLSDSRISDYANLIGFNAKGAVYDAKTGDIVEVKGMVKEILKGMYEDYAVMNGVNVEIAEVITETPSTDPNFIRDYLEARKDGQEVAVLVIDRVSGHKVPVTARLREYTIENGKITAVLDQLNVPVDSIYSISPVSQETQGQ